MEYLLTCLSKADRTYLSWLRLKSVHLLHYDPSNLFYYQVWCIHVYSLLVAERRRTGRHQQDRTSNVEIKPSLWCFMQTPRQSKLRAFSTSEFRDFPVLVFNFHFLKKEKKSKNAASLHYLSLPFGSLSTSTLLRGRSFNNATRHISKNLVKHFRNGLWQVKEQCLT